MNLINQLVQRGVSSIVSIANRSTLAFVTAMNQTNFILGKDLKLISFDDIEAFEYVNPLVSALHQQISLIGAETVARLMNRLAVSTEQRKHTLIACDFIARGSH